MDYKGANKIGNTGLSELTTRLMTKDDMSFGSALGSAAKMKIAAASKRMTGVVDPLNIVRLLTFKSPVMTALAGKMMGRSKQDISYFTNGRYGGAADISVEGTSKRNTRDGVHHTRIGPGKSTQLKVGDGMADILAKTYNLIRLQHEKDLKDKKISRGFEEEKNEESKRQLEKLFGEKGSKSKKAKALNDVQKASTLMESEGVFGSLLSVVGKLFTSPVFWGIMGGAGVIGWFNGWFDKFDITSGKEKLQQYNEKYKRTYPKFDSSKGVSTDDAKYLQALALVESGGTAGAAPATSSAAGLYGITDETWNSAAKTSGKNYPLSMRTDPKASAEMALEVTRKNKASLNKSLGRESNAYEMYMSHFLGPAGGPKFIKGMAKNPDQLATNLVNDDAVNANLQVFYKDSNITKALNKSVDYIMKTEGLSKKDAYRKAAKSLRELLKQPRTAREVFDMMGGRLENAYNALSSGKFGGKEIPEAVREIPSFIGGSTASTLASPAPTSIPSPTTAEPAIDPLERGWLPKLYERVHNKAIQQRLESDKRKMMLEQQNNTGKRLQTSQNEYNSSSSTPNNIIVAPQTNNIVNNKSVGSSESPSRGVNISIRNDDNSLKIAQTKYAISGIV